MALAALGARPTTVTTWKYAQLLAATAAIVPSNEQIRIVIARRR